MFVILLQGLKIKVSTRSGEPKPADRIQNHHREAFASPCLGTVFKCHRAFRAARGGREEARTVRAGRGHPSFIPGRARSHAQRSLENYEKRSTTRTGSAWFPRDVSRRASGVNQSSGAGGRAVVVLGRWRGNGPPSL